MGVVIALVFVLDPAIPRVCAPWIFACHSVQRQLLFVLSAWIVAAAHWLGWAYALEFLGWSVHLPVWIASLGFMAANTWLLRWLILILLPRPSTKPIKQL